MLLTPKAVDTVADILDGSEFYRQSHTTIYQAAVSLHAQGKPVDAITLTDRLQETGQLDTVGGQIRIYELAALVPAPGNVAHYARIVHDAAVLRGLIRAGGEISRLGWERPGEVTSLVDQAEQIMYEVGCKTSQTVSLDPGVHDYYQTLRRLRDNPGEIIGIPSGFHVLDEITQGFVPGNLIIVGARPSMGKSAFALCVTAHLIGRDRPVGIISPEMSKPEIMQRLVSIGANVPGESLRDPRRMSPDEWARAVDLEERLARRPLYVRDDGAITPLEVRAQVRRLKAKVPELALVVVDYLQLMTTGGRHSGDNRVQEVSEISRALKMTARDLDVPILALSQLSRALEQRVDKRPVLADLRESGSIEQDADVCIFLYRDSYYNEPEVPLKVEWVDVNVAKHRNGPTGRVQLGFKKDQARFVNAARPHLIGDVAA